MVYLSEPWYNNYLENNFDFIMPISLRMLQLELTLTTSSTFSGLRLAVTVLPATLKTLVLAAGHLHGEDDPDAVREEGELLLVVPQPVQLVNVTGCVWKSLIQLDD